MESSLSAPNGHLQLLEGGTSQILVKMCKLKLPTKLKLINLEVQEPDMLHPMSRGWCPYGLNGGSKPDRLKNYDAPRVKSYVNWGGKPRRM